MRLLMLMACMGVAFAQSNQDTETNMSCVERLKMPLYPPLAAAARIPGTMTVAVVVASNGSIQTNIAGHPLLAEAVEKALRASTFRKTCGGKSVRLIFNFVIDEDSNPGPQRVSFGYPNQFWISVTPQLMETQAMISRGAR